MKLKFPQLIALFLIIILVTSAIFIFTREKKSIKNTSQNEVKSSSEIKKLSEILQFGDNRECTFTSEGNMGTIYITQNKLRGDFTTPDGLSASIIRDQEFTYIWGTSLSQGIKISNQKISIDDLTQNSDLVNPNTQIDYNCMDWTIDQNKFTIPSDISFQDVSATINKVMESENTDSIIENQ